MGIVTAQTEFIDIMAKVLLSIPAGFVFDEVYIIEQLSAQYPDKYLNFCALYADRKEPMEMASEAICGVIETFEGVLIEEQNLTAHFPTLYSSLSYHKMWKKI
jgi:hypothetical protein